MRWKTQTGSEVWHSDTKYRINWSRKAPSKGAQLVKDFLKKHCSSYIWFEEYRLPTGLLRVDFLTPTKKIAVEFHGRQHTEFVRHFHKDRYNYGCSIQRDMAKIEMLELNGYTVVEIFEDDLKELSRAWFKDKYNITI